VVSFGNVALLLKEWVVTRITPDIAEAKNFHEGKKMPNNGPAPDPGSNGGPLPYLAVQDSNSAGVHHVQRVVEYSVRWLNACEPN
jgi:hypothetical protein